MFAIIRFNFNKASFTLYWCNFCTGTEGVADRLRLHCTGAEVVPNSLTVYTVPVAFVNQITVLLCIVKEHDQTFNCSLVLFLNVLSVSSSCFEL